MLALFKPIEGVKSQHEILHLCLKSVIGTELIATAACPGSVWHRVQKEADLCLTWHWYSTGL